MVTGAHTRPKILIVEDELLVAMDVELQLTALGYEVAGVANTGLGALQRAEATRPDLVLMDINLGGSMDGVAIAAQLRQRGSDTAIVFVTAYGGEEALHRTESVHHSRHLIKPYQPQDLAAIVRSALQSRWEEPSEALPLSR